MLGQFYQWLMNRKSIATEKLPSATCQIPGCERKAADQWLPSVCALREAEVNVDWVAVCAEHDAEINEITTRFFFGDRYDGELKAYRDSRLGLIK